MTTDIKIRAFHMGLAAYYSFGTYYFLCRMSPPQELLSMLAEAGLAQLNPFKFLTFWDMLLQSMYFILASVNDIYGTNMISKKKQCRLQQTRDYLFTSVVFTCASVVTICFWGLYAIDRKLIFPESMDTWFPSWVNHNIHTAPLFGVLLEMYLVYHAYPERSKGLTTVCLFGASYLGFLLYTTWSSGMWTYPVLAMLPLWWKVSFLAGAYALVCFLYICGEYLNQVIWAPNMDMPLFMKEKVKINADFHSYQTRNRDLLDGRLHQFNNPIMDNGLKLWNSLPNTTKSLPTFDMLKTSTKALILNKKLKL